MGDIKKLFRLLTNLSLLKIVGRPKSIFYDEPRKYTFSALIDNSSPYFQKYGYQIDNGAAPHNILCSEKIYGSGLSFFSKKNALIRCLGEAVERLSLYCFRQNDFLISHYDEIKAPALDPSLLIDDKSVQKKTFSWIEGYDYFNAQKCMIPSQLVYLNYKRIKDEPRLSVPISTGAAGGFEFESTLSRAIYEVVERDAFMTTYLNKIPSKQIEIKSIKNKHISIICSKAERYALEIHVFDITNDLKIPTYLTLLIDKTGIGPAVSVGLKSGLHQISSIVGSIEESFLSRSWIRFQLFKKGTIKKNELNKPIQTFLERGEYWYNQKNIDHLNFLLHSKCVPFQDVKTNSKNMREELKMITEALKDLGFPIYYASLSLEDFKDIHYQTLKVIIPGLQPLYLDENHRFINSARLEQVARFFNVKYKGINDIPHPFL